MLERVDRGNLKNCARLYNREIEILVADSLGLVISAFAPLRGENFLHALGHQVRTEPLPGEKFSKLQPARVNLEEREGRWCFIQDDTATLGIKREMEIALDGTHPGVRVIHRITNTSSWSLSIGLVCSTALAPEGIAVAPLPASHMRTEEKSSKGALLLFDETNLSDPRWIFGRETILLKYREAISTPLRVGLTNSSGWLAYWRSKVLMVVSTPFRALRQYPRGGASSELACSPGSMELVTSSPLHTLLPTESLEHIEQWRLYRDVPEPASEEIVMKEILPRLVNP